MTGNTGICHNCRVDSISAQSFIGVGEKMADVVVIAGTSEARQIIDRLLNNNVKVAATVTTGYGSELLGEHPNLRIYQGRLSGEEIAGLITGLKAKCLVDASHPFARDVSLNAIQACSVAQVPYLRFEREGAKGPETDGVVCVGDFKQAAQEVAGMDGNILLTIGSNNLGIFTKSIPDYRKRLFARVLPESSVVAKCEAAGLVASNIIAVKGPFSYEMNLEMIKYCHARILVTKDSGKAGGVDDKLKAAKDAGIEVVLIKKPDIRYNDTVSSIDEVVGFAESCMARDRTVV